VSINNGRLGSEARDLLAQARKDGAPARSRKAMWEGIEKSMALAPAASSSAAAPGAQSAASPATSMPAASTKAAVSTVTSAKASFLGALLGSAVAVSVAAVMFHQPTVTNVDESSAEAALDRGARQSTAAESLTPPVFPSPVVLGQAPPAVSAAREAPVAAKSPSKTAANAASNETLLREAARVAEARGSLLHGDPNAALASIRAARAEGRSLEPEELSIEVRALRSLGRFEEAAKVESLLRTRYPNHALAH
jgi:hypothetical protein